MLNFGTLTPSDAAKCPLLTLPDVKFDDIMRRAGRVISPSSKVPPTHSHRRDGMQGPASPTTDSRDGRGRGRSLSMSSLSPSGRRRSPSKVVYAEERGTNDPG